MKPKVRRIVSLPYSIFLEDNLKGKTIRTGILARFLAVYRVSEVWFFPDKVGGAEDNLRVVKLLLDYVECPQYLRKLLFPKMPELRYVGLLPPLRTPHHPLPGEKKRFREGVVLRYKRNNIVVEVGLEKPVLVKGRAKVGERVTVDILKKKIVRRDDIPFYWGFSTKIFRTLDSFMATGEYKVFTSRHGKPITSVLEKIVEEARKKGVINLVFGSRRGLYEILGEEFVERPVNLIPWQGTATVRTEEAMAAALSIVNLVLD